MSVTIDDLQFLWREADNAFQQHRAACSTCRWNPRARSQTRLCPEGQSLFQTAENLLMNLNEAKKG